MNLIVQHGFGQQKSIAQLQCLRLLICVALWDGEHTEAVAFGNSVFRCAILLFSQFVFDVVYRVLGQKAFFDCPFLNEFVGIFVLDELLLCRLVRFGLFNHFFQIVLKRYAT